MPYTSKFTEIFDINSTYKSFNVSSEEIPPEVNRTEELSKSIVNPIKIPLQKRDIPMTPPQSPQTPDKHSEALSYRFKSFLNSISRKRDRSISPTSSNSVLTK